MPNPLYDTIGHAYTSTRREDPEVLAQIMRALGDAQTIVNVGAGAGSYEPTDRHVIAIEPSDVMTAQRPAHRVPAIRASAESLPLRDQSVDAAMSVLSLHHWGVHQTQGIREMRRVARGLVIILTCDPTVSGQMWLMADYFPEIKAIDDATFPSIESICTTLGGTTKVEILPISRHSPDWSLMSFWAHPERVLDPVARNATSGFARQPAHVVNRVVAAVESDLKTGTWDRNHGHLRNLESFDAGLRMLVNLPT